MYTREEELEMSKWPDGMECHNCGSDEIKCFGETEINYLEFGCPGCGYKWQEGIEED